MTAVSDSQAPRIVICRHHQERIRIRFGKGHGDPDCLIQLQHLLEHTGYIIPMFDIIDLASFDHQKESLGIFFQNFQPFRGHLGKSWDPRQILRLPVNRAGKIRSCKEP